MDDQPDMFGGGNVIPRRIGPSHTIAQGRDWFALAIDDDGKATCPVCDHGHQVYVRSLYWNQLRGFCEFVEDWERSNDAFIGIRPTGIARWYGDFSKLRLWGLIDRENPSGGAKRTAVKWCVTTLGLRFYSGSVRIKKSVIEFHSAMIGHPPGVCEVRIDEVMNDADQRN